jgi:hypothetical protein
MEATPSPNDRLLEVIRLREEVDLLAEAMVAPHRVFRPVSLQTPPRLEPAELGFIRSVAYLYVLYYEVGDVAIPYLLELWDAFSLDNDHQIRDHYQIVRSLRTLLQHSLDPTSSTDRQTRERCQRWFARQCRTFVPSTEDHWSACLHGILTEAASFLRTMITCLRAIEGDEGRDGILERWRIEISRHHPPEEFDRIIEEAAHDLGRPHIDAVRIRKRYYDQWTDKLSYLSLGYSFQIEARRLVEYALLVDLAAGIPVTGEDIMTEFGLAPGPEVGALLTRAKAVFEESPRDRADLLATLKAELESENQLVDQPPKKDKQMNSSSDGEPTSAHVGEGINKATEQSPRA